MPTSAALLLMAGLLAVPPTASDADDRHSDLLAAARHAYADGDIAAGDAIVQTVLDSDETNTAAWRLKGFEIVGDMPVFVGRPDYAMASDTTGYSGEGDDVAENRPSRGGPTGLSVDTLSPGTANVRETAGRDPEDINRIHRLADEVIEQGIAGDGRDNDTNIRAAAHELIGMADAAVVRPTIARLANHEDVATRRALVEVLAAYHTDETTLHLLGIAMFDSHDKTRAAAAFALAVRDDPRIVSALTSGLVLSDDTLVNHAADALRWGQHLRAVPSLIGELRVPPNSRFRSRQSVGMWVMITENRFFNERNEPLTLRIRPSIASSEEPLEPGSLRESVLTALQDLTGQPLPGDAQAWQTFWDEQGKAMIERRTKKSHLKQ